jgi:hypothetical protein
MDILAPDSQKNICMEAFKSFTINRGINKAVEFKGLKAQYIWYVAGAVIGSMVLFGVMYIVGISSLVCVPVALGVGGLLVNRVYRLCRKYGQFGLMKRRARKEVPVALLSGSRKFFIHLFSDYASATK